MMSIKQTLTEIADLALENVHSPQEGYALIHEWAEKALQSLVSDNSYQQGYHDALVKVWDHLEEQFADLHNGAIADPKTPQTQPSPHIYSV